jgi:hypothetical protein
LWHSINFKVSIVTSPDSDLSVEKEIRLAKLGLLYADEVSLCSPNMTILLMMTRLAHLNEKEKIEFTRSILPSLHSEIVQLNKIENIFKEYDNTLSRQAENLFLTSGLHEAAEFIKSGQIKLNIVDMSGEQAAQNIFNEIKKILNEPSTYPIFDHDIENLTNAYIRENQPEIDLSNSKEMVFSKELIFNLPNMEDISFDNILKLKSELELELSKFKGLIYDYSTEINNLPFSPENKILINKKFEREIKPQLLELQKQIDENKFTKNLFSDTLENLTKYSIIMGVATLGDLEKTLLGTGGLTIAETLSKAFKETKKQNAEVKSNSLYFYHRLSRA